MTRLITLLFTVSLIPAPALAALEADVVAAPEVHAASTHGIGTQAFTSRAGVRVPLVIDAQDLQIQNPAFHGRLYPIDDAAVRAALAEMYHLTGPPVGVTIYCLPGYPSEVGRSFAVGAEIFLAPGFDQVPAQVVAYTVVHEIGHVVQHDRMPGRRGDDWRRYLHLRGLEDASVHHDRAPHRDRPGEIFAEDFRALFGGPLATYSGTLENPNLEPPQRVDGLIDHLRAVLARPRISPAPLASMRNHPNPFNPQTTIVLQLGAPADAGPVHLDILDVRGRVVRRLGTVAAADEIRLVWTGTDDTGRRVSSGHYFCRARTSGQTLTNSMLLVR